MLLLGSFYNYQSKGDESIPDARTMAGACTTPVMRSLCGDHARIHESLALLGRTALESTEQALFQQPIHVNDTTKNPIFLYEIRQLDHFQSNLTQRNQDELPLFWSDLSQYLGLNEPARPQRFQKEEHPYPIVLNICESRYDGLRRILIENGRVSAKWIREYFLDADNVIVSDRPYFESLLDTWSADPCLGRRRLEDMWLDKF